MTIALFALNNWIPYLIALTRNLYAQYLEISLVNIILHWPYLMDTSMDQRFVLSPYKILSW